jgi:putative ATP-dependent endonuclease of the OLD family
VARAVPAECEREPGLLYHSPSHTVAGATDMLLRRVEIRNFRGLRSASVDFDPTTALVGENSAGKTTLLDAIAICCSGRDDEVCLEVRDFHQSGDQPPADTLSIALIFEESNGEWREAAWEAFRPFVQEADGRRRIRLEVTGSRDPQGNAVSAAWTFGADRAAQSPAGLLTAWRRLTPMLRLRANRYFEQDPRGDSGGGAAGDSVAALSVDPVERQLEQQIRLVYNRLTGDGDIQEDELRRGLEAAGTYLAAHGTRQRATAEWLPPLMSDLVETPVRSGRQTETLLSSIKHGTGTRGMALVALVGVLLEARRRQPMPDEAQPLLVLEDAEAHLHPTMLAAMWEIVRSLPAQTVLTTNSGELLAAIPLRYIRRIVTNAQGTRVYRIDVNRYSVDDLRRIAYHVRIKRAGAFFARCWVLVEGETEAWLLPEFARLCGYNFPAEGIRFVEFAQSGLTPLLRLANDLGIEWHLLTDGDEAGHSYAACARAQLQGRPVEDRVTMLEDRDIEHCLYYNGYADLYRKLAGAAVPGPKGKRARERATHTIARAIHARSKPGLALSVLEAANQPGSPGVPAPLSRMIETAVRLARQG